MHEPSAHRCLAMDLTTLTTLTAACTALFRAGCASQALQAQTAA